MKCVLSLLAVPLLAQQGLNLYTVERERALGQQYASEIRRQSKPLGIASVDTYVERISRELVTALKDRPLDLHFEVISGGTWTESFSLPGGYIFVPARAFVTARDESEFVGMLAHTMGHVALRHGTRTATVAQVGNMSSIPLVFIGGHHSRTLTPLSLLEVQRTYELEADRFGLELAAGAGYDAAAFQRYVERTHPADSKMSPLPGRDLRLARIREIVAPLPSPKPSSGEEFRRVQELVRWLIERPEQRRVPTLRRAAQPTP